MKNKVAVVFIGTGKYVDFYPRWKFAVDNYFLNECDKTVIAFSDTKHKDFEQDNTIFAQVPPCVWPQATLYRYKFVKALLDTGIIDDVDYLFYIDADLYALENITLDEVTSLDKPLTGVHHPGNFTNPGWETFERRPASTAAVGDLPTKLGKKAIYHQGCFWGGKLESVRKMVTTLDNRITEDESNGIHAIWYDESQMNKYFLENIEDVYTTPWNFAFPEAGDGTDENFYDQFLKPDEAIKMIHANKSDSEYPRYPSDGVVR